MQQASMNAEGRAAHLVLGAGGVRVLSSLGALVELERAGVRWRSISACSAGSVLGALLAAGLSAEDLMRIVLSEDMRRLAGSRSFLGRVLRFLKPPYACYATSGIPDFFTDCVRRFRGIDHELTLEDLSIPFATTGIDVATSELILFRSRGAHQELPVADALRFAVAVPGLYPPLRFAGRRVVDAAIATQMPVWLAPDDELPIFLIAPSESESSEEPRGFPDFLRAVITAGVLCRDQYQINQIPRVRLIEPQCGTIHAEDFRRAEAQKRWLIERGQAAVLDAVARLPRGRDVFDLPNIPLRWRLHAERSGDPETETSLQRVRNQTARSIQAPGVRRIFISYAHEDSAWCHRLLEMLDPYRLAVWADQAIAPGDQWREKINNALRSASVAILLLSPDFFGSEFILDEELRYFSDPTNRDVRKIPVLLRACSWQSHEAIHPLQILNPETPLAELQDPAEQTALLHRICEQVRMALDKAGEAPMRRR